MARKRKRKSTRKRKRRSAPKRRRTRRRKRRSAPKRKRTRRKKRKSTRKRRSYRRNPSKRRRRRSRRRTHRRKRNPYKRRRRRRSKRRSYRRKRNPGGRYSIRTKNPAITDILIPALIGGLGFIGARILINKLTTGKSPLLKSDFMVVGTGADAIDLKPIVLPVAAGAVAALVVPKYLPKYSKYSFGLGMGLMMAGLVFAVDAFVIRKMKMETQQKIGLVAGAAGYVRSRGMSGYVTSPFMSGYVRSRSLGQVEPGGISHIPGTDASRALPPGRAYGRGMPMPNRTYNNWRFGGVYGGSVYEDQY